MGGRYDPDVLVVGAGPAGSTAAGLLARRSWSVLMVDRTVFPRPKPCGECLNPMAVAWLERLGVLDSVMALAPAHLRGWEIRSGGGARARGSFRTGARGLALRRSHLDAALLGHALAGGARLVAPVRVRSVAPAPAPGRRPSVLGRGPDGGALNWKPRFVVGADGLRSVVARSLGTVRRQPRLRKLSLTCHVSGPSHPCDRGLMFLDAVGSVGLAPLCDDGSVWNATVVVGADALGREVARDPMALFRARLRAAHPGSAAWSLLDGPLASGPFDWPSRRAHAPGVVLCGDAAGYYDPLTGQGIARALLSGVRAADAVHAALSAPGGATRALADYDAGLRRDLGPGRRLQHLIEHTVSGGAREPLLGLLARRARLADALVDAAGDVSPVRSLARPGLWLGR